RMHPPEDKATWAHPPPSLLCRCLSSDWWLGPGVLLLAAAGPAVSGGYGQRTQPSEHSRRVLPRRPRVCRSPTDTREPHWRAVRQLPAIAAVDAPCDCAIHSVCGWSEILPPASR